MSATNVDTTHGRKSLMGTSPVRVVTQTQYDEAEAAFNAGEYPEFATTLFAILS
jgi:hypothetical protein